MVKSAAYKDGRLRRGDEILSIDDVSVVGSTHRHAISLMSSAAANNKVKLTIRRWNNGSRSGSKRSFYLLVKVIGWVLLKCASRGSCQFFKY